MQLEIISFIKINKRKILDFHILSLRTLWTGVFPLHTVPPVSCSPVSFELKTKQFV